MGQKVRIKHLPKKISPYFSPANVPSWPWLSDFKHDFENQLVKIKQRIENIHETIPYESGRKPIEHFEEACSNNPREVADWLIFIDRIVHQMFCEIACLTVLEGDIEKIEQYKFKRKHVLHKIFRRILRIYSQELRNKNIRTSLLPSYVEWEINEDIFSAILLKIIANCAKYCKNDSELKIVIWENSVSFYMDSLKIEPYEKERIFDENFSWRNSKRLSTPSSWKGLFHARKLAIFHSLVLDVNIWLDSWESQGNPYAFNEFYIKKGN